MNGHYDFIGDIHGYASILERLLKCLGYEYTQGYWSHPERTAVFLGDWIDRGPENLRTLGIVKGMVDHGSALAVLGNHEYNALCYHTPAGSQGFLRSHNTKHFQQHRETLAEIETAPGREQWARYLEWFRSLPFFLELTGFRVVHACWDEVGLGVLQAHPGRDANGRLTDEFLAQSCSSNHPLYQALETLLKGEEIPLPEDCSGVWDKDGILRKHVRLQWWLPQEQLLAAKHYGEVARVDDFVAQQLRAIPLTPPVSLRLRQRVHTTPHTPIFIGHYWFSGPPRLLNDRVVSLDFSVAAGGALTCYRWDGEKTLLPHKLVSLPNPLQS